MFQEVMSLGKIGILRLSSFQKRAMRHFFLDSLKRKVLHKMGEGVLIYFYLKLINKKFK